MEEQLIETWNIHDRIHRYLLKAVPDDALGVSLGPKHRTVFQLFAHLHNVRLLWLKTAAPELMTGLAKIEGETGDKRNLALALEGSGHAIAALLRQSLVPGGKVKGFKPHPVAFLGYLIAHESHHRGHIGWTLKNSGHPLDQKKNVRVVGMGGAVKIAHSVEPPFDGGWFGLSSALRWRSGSEVGSGTF